VFFRLRHNGENLIHCHETTNISSKPVNGYTSWGCMDVSKCAMSAGLPDKPLQERAGVICWFSHIDRCRHPCAS
jgi:hypothetical protein